MQRLGPGRLRLAAGLDVGADLGFLRGRHLRRGVVDDGERGRSGAQRVVGRHRLRAAVEAHQLRRQHAAAPA